LIFAHWVAPTPEGEAPGPVLRKNLQTQEPIPDGVVWLDLIEPTLEEDHRVEAALNVAIPTRADDDYVEPAESHYSEGGARYLHAHVVTEVDGSLDTQVVVFILTPKVLVTVRYGEIEAFDLFASRYCRSGARPAHVDDLATQLILTIINRSARALTKVAGTLEEIGTNVFRKETDRSLRAKKYSTTLNSLGEVDETVSRLRESLVSIERVVLFLSTEVRSEKAAKTLREATKTAQRDLQSLEEDASFKAQKIQFLLDATLGLINLEQNDIIKLFSVLAVIFMPPTLIASIYGMNFKEMPELEYKFGYPLALGAMVLAAIGPYLFFRWKRWL
jgi:magnesium transporter